MRKFAILALVLCLTTGLLGFTAGNSSAGKNQKKVKWIEVEAGLVPAEFGDLASFTGTPNNYTLVFKDDGGTLRVVSLRGNKILPKAMVLKRN